MIIIIIIIIIIDLNYLYFITVERSSTNYISWKEQLLIWPTQKIHDSETTDREYK